MKKRMRIVLDGMKPMELRVFAGLELFCFPVSILTIATIPLLAVNRFWWNIPLPTWADVAIKILLAAATGYITNYIAVTMLFKPYHDSKRHLLSVLTFGYWSQGLIPRNKPKLAVQMGEESEKLVDPEKIANDLCSMVGGLLDNPQNLNAIENAVRGFIASKETMIVETCLPAIENMCVQKTREFVTEDRLLSLWNEVIKPKLSSDGLKDAIIGKLIAYINMKVPDMIPSLKEEVRMIIYHYFETDELFQTIAIFKPDFPRSYADKIVDEKIKWKEVAQKICNRIEDAQTKTKLKAEMQNIILETENWLASEAGTQQIGRLVESVRKKISDYLISWLEKDFGKLVSGAVRSEGVWEYVRNKLIPEIKPSLENWLRGPGKDLVLSKLQLKERITTAINDLGVEEFHERVNTIAAQHLGAIQVLGYFLGALVGVGLLVLG